MSLFEKIGLFSGPTAHYTNVPVAGDCGSCETMASSSYYLYHSIDCHGKVTFNTGLVTFDGLWLQFRTEVLRIQDHYSGYANRIFHLNDQSILVQHIKRPGKLDLLFRISHLLNLHVGWWSLFIIHY